jgi:hypothetical protein
LPEVHVGEKARESGNTVIYEAIMAADTQYDIMDDYSRTTKAGPPKVGYLNGDTAV